MVSLARVLGIAVSPAESEVCMLGSATLFCITAATYVLQPLRDGAALAVPSLSPAMLVFAPLLLTAAANASIARLSRARGPQCPRSAVLPLFLRASSVGLLALCAAMWAVLPTRCSSGDADGSSSSSSGGGGGGLRSGAGLGSIEGGRSWQLLRAAFFLWCSVFGVLAASLGWGAAGGGLVAARARRLLGPVGAGCTLGQLAGSGLVAASVRVAEHHGQQQQQQQLQGGGCEAAIAQLQMQLLLLPAAAAVLWLASRFATRLLARTAAAAAAAGRVVAGCAKRSNSSSSSSSSSASVVGGAGSSAVTLLRASPYLQRVACYTCCYAFSSAVLFFIKLELVAGAATGAAAAAAAAATAAAAAKVGDGGRLAAASVAAPPALPSARMASFSAGVNFVAALCTLLAQLFGTARVTRHLRAATTLAFLPATAFCGLLALLLAVPRHHHDAAAAAAGAAAAAAGAATATGYGAALSVLAAAQVTQSVANYALAKPARESLWAADMVTAEQRLFCKPLLDTGANRLGFALAAAWYSAVGNIAACSARGGALGAVQLLVPAAWFCVALQLGADCVSRAQQQRAKGHPAAAAGAAAPCQPMARAVPAALAAACLAYGGIWWWKSSSQMRA